MQDKKYELRKQVKSVRWIIFWVVLAQFAAEIAIEAALSFMSNPPHQYWKIATIELLAIGVPLSIYAKTAINGGRRNIKRELCLNRCTIANVILAIVLGVSGQFVMMLLNVPANYIMTTFFHKNVSDSVVVATTINEVVLGVFAVVLIPAVLEEFWMRGVIFSAYNRCNTNAAVIFTGLVFAILHFRVSEFVGFFLMGITASVLVLKTRSLYTSMIYHGFSNLTALLFGAYIMPYIIDYVWVVFAIMSLIFVLAFVALVKQKKGAKSTQVFNFGSLLITSIFSLPVILSAATVVIKFILLKVAG